MLELDGSEGGGQLVRTALTLSALTGTPFRMTGIRGNRSTPGLRAQHLACVEAVAAIADAEVRAVDDDADSAGPAQEDDTDTDDDDTDTVDTDDEDDTDEDDTNTADTDDDDDTDNDEAPEPVVGTEALVFEPGAVTGGEYAVDIGTAGSVTLLLDAVLPLATALAEPLRLTVRGGTDVKWSPPVDYLRYVKLPLGRRHGLAAALEVHRRGFYPEGGGAVTLHLAPSSLTPVDLTGRERASEARVYSVASADLADAEVAERGAVAAADQLNDADVEVVERATSYGATRSTGSAVVVALGGGTTGIAPAGFDALGERGKPSEAVAGDAVDAALAFRDGAGAVDANMADQLVPYLALAGGEAAVPRVTDHVATCVALVGEFGFEVAVEERAGDTVLAAPAGAL